MNEITIPFSIGGQSHSIYLRFHLDEGLDIIEARVMRPTVGPLASDVGPAPEWMLCMIERDFEAGGPIFEAAHKADIQRINRRAKLGVTA